MADQSEEVTSFNKGLVEVDFGDIFDISIKELERRLELAVAFVGQNITCASYACGGEYNDNCNTFVCQSFASDSPVE